MQWRARQLPSRARKCRQKLARDAGRQSELRDHRNRGNAEIMCSPASLKQFRPARSTRTAQTKKSTGGVRAPVRDCDADSQRRNRPLPFRIGCRIADSLLIFPRIVRKTWFASLFFNYRLRRPPRIRWYKSKGSLKQTKRPPGNRAAFSFKGE